MTLRNTTDHQLKDSNCCVNEEKEGLNKQICTMVPTMYVTV